MDDFPITWLDLREPADHAARDPVLLAAACALVDGADDPLIVDLGCGTGSTLRALAPRLARPASWRLVDGDAALLAEARRRHPEAAVDVVRQPLAGNVLFPFQDATLVTASALVDLVSETWIARLVATLASRRAALYTALTYDGTMAFDPAHPLDEAVVAAFNRDQRRDKGFGPALGPTATDALARVLDRAGYGVQVAKSPWRLGPDQSALAQAHARGVAAAVATEGGLDAAAVDDWLAFRLAAADGSAEIGHEDLFARPL